MPLLPYDYLHLVNCPKVVIISDILCSKPVLIFELYTSLRYACITQNVPNLIRTNNLIGQIIKRSNLIGPYCSTLEEFMKYFHFRVAKVPFLKSPLKFLCLQAFAFASSICRVMESLTNFIFRNYRLELEDVEARVTLPMSMKNLG